MVKTPQEVRIEIESSGVSVAEWARENKFSSGLVYQVLEGRRKCVRGQSYRIAIALGLKAGNPMDVKMLSKLLSTKTLPAPATETREEQAM